MVPPDPPNPLDPPSLIWSTNSALPHFGAASEQIALAPVVGENGLFSKVLHSLALSVGGTKAPKVRESQILGDGSNRRSRGRFRPEDDVLGGVHSLYNLEPSTVARIGPASAHHIRELPSTGRQKTGHSIFRGGL